MNPIIIAACASACILFAVGLVLLWEAKALRMRRFGKGRHRGRVPAMRWLRLWLVLLIAGCACALILGVSAIIALPLAAMGVFVGLIFVGEAEDHAASHYRRY